MKHISINQTLRRPLMAGIALIVALSSLVSAQAGINIDRASYTQTGGQLDLYPGDVFHTWGDTIINAMAFNNHGIDVNVEGNFQDGTRSWCQFHQWGGTLNVGGYLSIGRYSGGSGSMDIYGGWVNSYNDSHQIIVGEQGTGYLSLSGGSIHSYSGLCLGQSGGWGGVYLNSGDAQVGGIWKGSGYGELIMNGGWITAQRGNWDFISGLNLARIDGGNAYINNNGNSIGINQTISGTGGANFSGSAWTTLRQNNTYSGDTVVNSGVLDFYESGSLYNNGTAAGNIYVQSGAMMNLNRDNTFGDAWWGSFSPVTITVNAGGALVNGAHFNNIANLVLNGGELRANGGYDSTWQAYELNNVTVGGTNASSITANESQNGYNGIELSSQGATTFNVGVTGDTRGDLLVSGKLIDIYNGNWASSSGLIKSGLGTMVLSGNNTYTGTTTIGSGVLDFVNANSLYNGTAGNWTASNITVSNGATLALGVGGSNSFTTDNVAAIIANLSGADGKGFLAGSSIGFDTTAGNFTATNNFADSVNGSLGLWVFGGNTLTMTGSNSNSGTITLSGGTLQIGNGGSSGTLGVGNVVDNGTLIFNRSGSSIFSNVISGTGAFVQGGSGTTILTGSNTYSGGTIISSGGTLQVGNGGSLGTLGTGSLTLNGTLAFNSSNSITVSDTISGSGSLAQNGAGTLTLSGTNTYTGGTIVNSGTIALGASGVGTITTLANIGSSTITVNNGGTLQFTAGNVFGWHTTSVLAPIVANAGGTVGIDSGVYDIVGPILLNGGTLRSLGSNSFSGFALKGDVTVNGGTNVSTISGTGFTLGAADVTGTTFNVASGGTASGVDLLISANIYDGAAPAWYPNTQASSLTKTGNGTMLLSGTNTYTGLTTISGGALLLNGTNTGTGEVSITGGTLGGTGSTAATVTVASGGSIKPGNGSSVGTLTVGGLTINSGGNLNIFLGTGSATSLLNVTGVATLGGTLNFTALGSLTAPTYTFFSDTNGYTGSFTTTNNMPSGYTLVYGSNSVYLQASADPFVTAQAVFAGTNQIITGGSTNMLVAISNNALSGNFVFTGTNGSNTAGSIGSTTLTAQTGTNAAGLRFNGTNVGAAQTGTITLNSTVPSVASTNLTVLVDVYGHASGSVTSTNLTLSNWIFGYTGTVASTNSVTLSNAAGFNVALGASNNSGGTITNVASLGAGSTTTLGASLSASGIGTGTFSSNVAITFSDASSLNGASTNVGTTNIQVTGNVYGHASGSISATNVNFGNAIVDYSPISTNLVLSNAAGFRVALNATGSTNGNFSLAGASSLTQGASSNAALTLASGQGTGTFSNSVTVVYGDASTLNGASTNLGTNTVVVTGAIYDHASAQLGSSTLFLGAHVGYSNALTSGGSVSLGNAAGFRVALSSSNGVSSNSRVTLDQSGNLAAGASTNLYAHLAIGQGAGAFTNVIGVRFADYSQLNGASTNLGSTNITLLGSVYTGKGVWTSGSGGNWTDLANWQLQGGTPGIDGALSANDTATFGALGSGTVALNTNASIETLTFSNAAASYTIAGTGTMTLRAGDVQPQIRVLAGTNTIATGLKLSTNVTLNEASGSSLILGGDITGGGKLTQTGGGFTILSGSNSYTGLTVVGGGVLEILNTNSLSGGTSLTVSNGATLVLGMGTNSSRSFSAAAFTGILNSLGSVPYNYKGLLTGANIGADVTGTNVTIGSAISNGANGLLGFSLFGNGTLTLMAPNTYTGTTTINSGVLQIGNGGDTGSLGSGDILDNGGLIYNLSGNAYSAIYTNYYTIANKISGSGSLTLNGAAKYTLTRNNGFSGGITLNGAALKITNDASLGALNGSITMNGGELVGGVRSGNLLINSSRTITLGAGGGILQAYGPTGVTEIASRITGSGPLSIAWDWGTVLLSGSNNYAGATVIGSTNAPSWFQDVSGYKTKLQLGNSNALPSGTALSFGSNDLNDVAVLDLNGYGATVSALNGSSNAVIKNTTGSLSLLSLSNNGANSYAGVINGNVALQLGGSGTLTLLGNKTYTGGTTLQGGSLILGSNSTLTGAVNLARTNTVMTLSSGAALVTPTATHLVSGRLIDNSGLAFTNAIKGVVSLNSTGQLDKSYAAGSSVAGFGATLAGLNKSFQILAGKVQNAATLTAKIVGGVLDFKGTYSNGVVLAIKDGSFSQNGLHNIQWYNTNAPTPVWTNTVAGNTGNVNNATFKDFRGSYSAFLAMLASNHISVDSGLSSIMGAYGYDSTTQTAWAVIDHNSLFGGAPLAPTPGVAAPAPPAFSYSLYAQNQNQRNVAKALDSFLSATTGDRQVVVTALNQLNPDQVPSALNAIMPTMYQSLATIAFNNANAQNMELNQRLWGVRIAEGGGFSMGGLADNYAVLQEGQGDGDGKGVLDAKKDILRPGLDNRWGMFVDGNGIFAQANSGNMLPGYNAQSGGITTGLSYKWNDRVATGLYAGYEGTYAKYGGGSSLIDNAVRFGLFGTYGQPDGKGLYVNALAGGAYNNYSVTRNIAFGSINRTANSSPGAGELDTMLGVGYDVKKGNFTFGPTASLQYTYFGANAVNETGAQSLDFNSAGWNTSSMLSSVGAHASYTWNARTLPGHEIVVVPQLSLNWQHEFLQNPYDITGNLGGTSPTFSNTSAPGTRDYLYTGVGFTVEFSKKWNTSFFYNAAAGNNDLTSQNIFWSAGVKF